VIGGYLLGESEWKNGKGNLEVHKMEIKNCEQASVLVQQKRIFANSICQTNKACSPDYLLLVLVGTKMHSQSWVLRKGVGRGHSDTQINHLLLPLFSFLLLLVLLSLQAEGTECVVLEVKRIISTLASKNKTVNSPLLWATPYLCSVF